MELKKVRDNYTEELHNLKDKIADLRSGVVPEREDPPVVDTAAIDAITAELEELKAASSKLEESINAALYEHAADDKQQQNEDLAEREKLDSEINGRINFQKQSTA